MPSIPSVGVLGTHLEGHWVGQGLGRQLWSKQKLKMWGLGSRGLGRSLQEGLQGGAGEDVSWEVRLCPTGCCNHLSGYPGKPSAGQGPLFCRFPTLCFYAPPNGVSSSDPLLPLVSPLCLDVACQGKQAPLVTERPLRPPGSKAIPLEPQNRQNWEQVLGNAGSLTCPG